MGRENEERNTSADGLKEFTTTHTKGKIVITAHAIKMMYTTIIPMLNFFLLLRTFGIITAASIYASSFVKNPTPFDTNTPKTTIKSACVDA